MLQRSLPALAMHDQLGDHRIIVNAHLIALAHAAVHAHVMPVWKLQPAQRAGTGQKAMLRVFRINARFHGMPLLLNLILLQRQRLSSRHPQLPFDQINAGDHFGDRMLDLQPGVHFHEVEILTGNDELNSTGTLIIDAASRLHGGFVHVALDLVGQLAGRRFLDDFLVAALTGAVAFEQVHDIAVPIAEYLHLNVTRALQIALQDHALIAKRTHRLALRRSQLLGKFIRMGDDAHALAATTGSGLDQQWVTDLIGMLLQRGGILIVTVIAGYHRHAGGTHALLGRGLGAHLPHGLGAGADQHQSGFGHGLGKCRVFRQKTIAGMNRFGAGQARCTDHFFNMQIRFCR